jgi:hypothetical protein
MNETITYGYDMDNQRHVIDRVILITEEDGTKYEMAFPSGDMKDSEALHYLFYFVNPGDNYTVTFMPKKDGD